MKMNKIIIKGDFNQDFIHDFKIHFEEFVDWAETRGYVSQVEIEIENE